MIQRVKDRLQSAVLALLLSVGLVMPLCGALDESLISPRVLYLIAAVIIVFETASLHKYSAIAVSGIAVIAGAGWILGGNGARMISDAGLAISLRMKGIMTAVPLASQPVTLLAAIGLTVLCCFATLRNVSCIPAVLLCIAVLMIVWITDSMQMILWLLPALAAVLTLVLTYRFEEPPAIRVLPWAAGLVALAFLIAGNGPADNPLKEKADEIRQAILDRLFFTEARDVFSLYSAGLSPQGAEQLGGKPNPSENPVMQVSTSRTTYLRGTVYNRYTGHGWQNTTGGRRYLWQSGRMAELRASLFDETLPPASVQNSLSNPTTVSVRMLSGSASTLFLPQRIRNLNPGGETVPYFSNSSEVFITRNLQAGDTWEVSAVLYNSTDPGIGTLTDICATMEDSRWNEVKNTYTELPSHLEQPVWNLAAEVTSMAETPYEKAIAIQNYLTRNYQYTLDVGEHPENIDFVTSFLLDTKKGYCTYFASAMTVLCRMAGLPARYVEGYLAEPDSNGEALVTGMNAHAWTEVYFSGFGWLTFDATPGHHSAGKDGKTSGQGSPTPEPTAEPTAEPTPEPTPEPPETQNTDIPTETPENSEGNPGDQASPGPNDTPDQDPKDSNEEPSDPPGPQEPSEQTSENRQGAFPWWLLILAAAAGIGFRVWMTSPSFREKRARTEEKRFDIWEDEIAFLLKAEQLERRNGETLMSFAGRIDKTALFSESIIPAAECVTRMHYSRAVPRETDTGLLRDTALLIRGSLSGKGRIRYMTRRLLSKKRIKRIIR